MQGEETVSEVQQEPDDAEYSDAVAQAMSLPWVSYTFKRYSTASEVNYPRSADTLCMISDEAQSEPQPIQVTKPKAQPTSDTASESKLDLYPLPTNEHSAFETPNIDFSALEDCSVLENFDFDQFLPDNTDDTFAFDGDINIAKEASEVETLLSTFTTLDEDEIDILSRAAMESTLTQPEESEMLE